jgi:co-chaperonin GroES (HSP10)
MGKVIPLDVNVGDHVLSGKWTGTDVLIDDRVARGLRHSVGSANQ